MKIEDELQSMNDFDTFMSSFTFSSSSSLSSIDSSLSSFTSEFITDESNEESHLYDEFESDNYLNAIDQILSLVFSQRYLFQ